MLHLLALKIICCFSWTGWYFCLIMFGRFVCLIIQVLHFYIFCPILLYDGKQANMESCKMTNAVECQKMETSFSSLLYFCWWTNLIASDSLILSEAVMTSKELLAGAWNSKWL